MSTHEGSLPGSERTVAAGTGGPLEERARELGRKADALSARVQSEFRDKAHEVGEMGHRIQERASVAKEKVAQGVHDGRARVESEVQTHPVRTLLYAAGVGLVVGLLLGRRSRR